MNRSLRLRKCWQGWGPRLAIRDWRLGLTGHPLGHSMSPGLHNAALAAAGLTGEYGLYPVAPEDEAGLAVLLARLRSGELHGLNVTIPHKQAVIPLLDALTPAARAIGAVNTILVTGDWSLVTDHSPFMLWGDNTDAPGFLRDVGRFLPERPSSEKTALVLGAGGSARAVVYALAEAGWQVTVAARRLPQAQALAAQMANVGEITAVTLNAGKLRKLTPGLLVNTTPVGMSPNVDASPWPEGVRMREGMAVYDLIYNPRETKLVRDARAAGLPAITGLGMLVEQAALAFTRWTGVEVDFGKFI